MKFPNNAEILTLEEFLGVLDKYKIGAQIELKEGGYEDRVLKIIEEYHPDFDNLNGPVVCTSFNWFVVKRLVKKAGNYEIPLYDYSGKKGLAFGMQGIALGIPIFGTVMLKKFNKMGLWGAMTHYKNLPPRMIAKAHRYNFKFCPRVPNNRELIMEYIKHDVDGFETDDVPFIRKCIEDAGYEPPPLPQK